MSNQMNVTLDAETLANQKQGQDLKTAVAWGMLKPQKDTAIAIAHTWSEVEALRLAKTESDSDERLAMLQKRAKQLKRHALETIVDSYTPLSLWAEDRGAPITDAAMFSAKNESGTMRFEIGERQAYGDTMKGLLSLLSSVPDELIYLEERRNAAKRAKRQRALIFDDAFKFGAELDLLRGENDRGKIVVAPKIIALDNNGDMIHAVKLFAKMAMYLDSNDAVQAGAIWRYLTGASDSKTQRVYDFDVDACKGALQGRISARCALAIGRLRAKLVDRKDSKAKTEEFLKAEGERLKALISLMDTVVGTEEKSETATAPATTGVKSLAEIKAQYHAAINAQDEKAKLDAVKLAASLHPKYAEIEQKFSKGEIKSAEAFNRAINPLGLELLNAK